LFATTTEKNGGIEKRQPSFKTMVKKTKKGVFLNTLFFTFQAKYAFF